VQLTQGLKRSAKLLGSSLATICGDRSTTWARFEHRVACLAAGLRDCGVREGGRVVILALNSDHYVEALYAIAWTGAVFVPFNTRWAIGEITAALEDCTPVAILSDDTFARQACELARNVQIPVIGLENPIGEFGIDRLIEDNTSLPDRCGRGDELAVIVYTGGTTGRSKGVMLSHANLIINFLLFHAAAPFDRDTRFLHTPPMFHLADLTNVFGITMLGGSHVILPGFEAHAVIDAIEQHQVNALVLVPTMIGMLCETLRTRPADLSGIRRMTYGASPISPALLQRAMAVMPNTRFCQGFGQTEHSPALTMLDHSDHLAGRLESCGRPLPGVDMRIVDDRLEDVPPGEIGEVIARGPSVMLGYWNQPELTAATVVNGWLRTGDAGRLDQDGYLYLVDRVKDMIVSGGENVYSAEVENALLAHPDVIQCAIIGVPDDLWGERVHAVIQLREGSSATETQLIEHCEPLIANYKRPKSIDLRFTPLPLSGVGKILKSELRAPFWADRNRQIG
jgi:long-chain acyl-CoA synthetase